MHISDIFTKAFGFLLCILLWMTGEWLSRAANIPLPGGTIGFLILLMLFAAVRPALAIVKPGADLLLNNIILFFMPPVLSVIAYPEFFGWDGLKLAALLILGTALMMVSMGLLAQTLLNISTRRQGLDRQGVNE